MVTKLQDPDDFRIWLKEFFVPAAGKAGCPCRFPRFRFLAGFFHRDFDAGPVGCIETELIVDTLFRREFTPYTSRTSDERGRITSLCSICHTEWIEDYEDYSISFYRSFVRPRSTEFEDVGAVVVFPFPLVFGFYAFQQEDKDRLSDRFPITDFATFERYLLEPRATGSA